MKKAIRSLLGVMFLALLVADAGSRFPVLDDLAFTNAIKSSGVWDWIASAGLTREGRFFPPFFVLQASFIYWTSSNVEVLLLNILLISSMLYCALKKYFLEALWVLLIFMVSVRYASFQTLFWQSGIFYFVQLAFFIYVILKFSWIEKNAFRKMIFLFLIGTCTYQVPMAFWVLLFARRVWPLETSDHPTFSTALAGFRLLIFEVLIVLFPLVFMAVVGTNERLVSVELNDSPYLLARAVFFKYYKWIPEWSLVFTLFFLLPFLSVRIRNSFSSWSGSKLLYWSFFIALAGLTSTLPTAILKGYYAIRVSIYWGFFTGVSLMLLAVLIVRFIRYAPSVRYGLQLSDIAQISGIFIGMLLYGINVQEAYAFKEKYVERESLLETKASVVPKISFKEYDGKQMLHYFGYSDEHMLNTGWMNDIYKNNYEISEIQMDNDVLKIRYNER